MNDYSRTMPGSRQGLSFNPADIGRRCACFNVRKAARMVTQLFDDVLRPTGLRVTQFSVLMGIGSAGRTPMGSLAEILGMDRTTLSRNLRLLEKAGLVDLEEGEDRREHVVALTDAGRQALEQAMPLWEQAQGLVREALGGEALDTLLRGLRRLAAVLR